MEHSSITESSERLQNELKGAKNAHEAEALANAFKSFMIVVGIQKNLKMKLSNA